MRAALDAAAEALDAAGCEQARLDAELLLAEALGTDRAVLLRGGERVLPAAAARRFDALVERRRKREPVAYLRGRKGFRHIELAVDSRVLVPRPETETLVEAAIELLPRGAHVIDVGTGSGAVALALAHERPDLEVTGSDVSQEALAVARGNGERLELGVTWVRSDLLAAAPGPWDAVVSNPPYVAEAQRDDLPAELGFEPPAALFAGADGLAVIAALVEQSAAAGAPLMAIEVGAGQASAVAELMGAAGYATVSVRYDLAGIERVVVAT